MKEIEVKGVVIIFLLLFLSCKGFQKADVDVDPNEIFLKRDTMAREVFRVVISSDRYLVSQMKYLHTIKRVYDPGGDKYMCEELKKYNKIDETRDGVIKIWLYPDSGRLMRVRPVQLTYLVEIDNLIVEDIQRWSFKFPKRVVTPGFFEIKYRVILQKKQTDEEIMKEVRDKIREKRPTR